MPLASVAIPIVCRLNVAWVWSHTHIVHVYWKMLKNVAGSTSEIEDPFGLMRMDFILHKSFPQPFGAHTGLKLAGNPTVLRQWTQMLNGHLWFTELCLGILNVGAFFKDHCVGNKQNRSDEHEC